MGFDPIAACTRMFFAFAIHGVYQFCQSDLNDIIIYISVNRDLSLDSITSIFFIKFLIYRNKEFLVSVLDKQEYKEIL